jgi:hypothetical protein
LEKDIITRKLIKLIGKGICQEKKLEKDKVTRAVIGAIAKGLRRTVSHLSREQRKAGSYGLIIWWNKSKPRKTA